MRLVMALALASALLLPACSDGSGPVVAGTYSLQQVDGQPLPRLLSATVNCDELLSEGALVLAADGGFSLTVLKRLDCSRVGGAPDSTRMTITGTMVTHDGTVLLHVTSVSPSVTLSGSASSHALEVGAGPLLSIGTATVLTFRLDATVQP